MTPDFDAIHAKGREDGKRLDEMQAETDAMVRRIEAIHADTRRLLYRAEQQPDGTWARWSDSTLIACLAGESDPIQRGVLIRQIAREDSE